MVVNRLSLQRKPAEPNQKTTALGQQAPKFGCAQFAHLAAKAYQGQDTFIRQCLSQGTNTLKSQSRDNPDGWGIAAYTDVDHLSITKSKEKAEDDPGFDQAVNDTADLKPLVTLAHVRKGPNVKVDNNHPFPIGKAILMHNGIVPSVLEEDLREKLNAFPREYQISKPKGTTDTELFARYLEGEMNRSFGTGDPTTIETKPLAEFFNEKVSELVSASKAMHHADPALPGFNFTLADDHRIFASRSGRSLNLGIRNDKDGNLQDVTIATRPMQLTHGTPIQWEEIPPDHMVIVERNNKAKDKPIVQISLQPLKLKQPLIKRATTWPRCGESIVQSLKHSIYGAA
jgi:predicted glutamine amidotransferase